MADQKPSEWREAHKDEELSPYAEFSNVVQWDPQKAMDLLWRYLDEQAAKSGSAAMHKRIEEATGG